MTSVRLPAVAGTFYPEGPSVLARNVDELLAHHNGKVQSESPKALIVPHAGYLYSGPIAASAYAQLAPLKGSIQRVVLLGPAHYVAVRGLALPKCVKFRTPLGEIALDVEGMRALEGSPFVTRNAAAHAPEHSLEVQLPFLQRVLGEFTLVPLVVGDADADAVADVLERVWGGGETLIVISSDLSHGLTDRAARAADAGTVDDILALRTLDQWQACGAVPVNGLLLAARRRGLRAMALDVRNSSQTAGDPGRVVGYGAFAFLPVRPSHAEQGATLLQLARAAIGHAFQRQVRAPADAIWLSANGATFVTLTINGQLRGCIGSIEARRPLHEDVKENALAAAFQDPRFKPLRPSEFDAMRIEVSLLSPAEPIAFTNEASAIAALRPHVDGVVFEYGPHRSVYLPQVWEEIPAPAEFLSHLKQKAGFPKQFWADGIHLMRFRVDKWEEPAQ